MAENETPSFHVEVRPDNIIVMHFDNLGRRVIEAWAAHIRAHDGKLRSPLRILYDLRDSGPPGNYALQVLTPLMKELTIPENTRNAYILSPRDFHFAPVIKRRMPAKVGSVEAFTDFDAAVAWLKEGMDDH